MESNHKRHRLMFEEEQGAAPPPELVQLVQKYVAIFELESESLKLTTSRKVYGKWLGRSVPSSYGGAYVFLTHSKTHAILINLERIDLDKPKSLEIVVCEELMHMYDWIAGDRRRHAKHGHDRIAYRVAELTGATLQEVRTALIPVQRRGFRYVYGCPRCGIRVKRRRKGDWACGRCYRETGKQHVLKIVEYLQPASEGSDDVQ